MKWKTVRNAGYIASEATLPRNRPNAAAAEFLEGVVEEFARASRRYFELANELPFIYRERQTHSVLLPAVAKVADAVLVETPVTRRVNRQDSYGWVDYWACFQDVDFFIEVKHRWHAVRANKVNTDTHNGWQDLTDQLDSLPPGAKEYTLSKHPLTIALLIVPCFQSSQDEAKLQPHDRLTTTEIYDLIRGELDGPKPNWSSIWHLHQDLQIPYSYDDWSELYPCVVFMACVSTLKQEE
ncbi:MAG: hypothetical protein KJ077_27170 [Anaerolineae bacterium]|nr:hypothetical protein [Anaerolineae bacterium]